MKRHDFGGYGDVAKAFNEKGAYHSPWVFEILRNLVPGSAFIIDVGCGTGNFTRELQRAGFKNVRGIDPDPRMIQTAREQERGKGLDTIMYGNGYVTDLGKGTFDMITCQWAFDNFCDDANCVAAIKAALAPDGAFVSLTWPSSRISQERSKTIDQFATSKRPKPSGSPYSWGDRSYAPLLVEHGFSQVVTHTRSVRIPYSIDEARQYMRRSGKLSTVPADRLADCHAALDDLCLRLQQPDGSIRRDITVILDIASL